MARRYPRALIVLAAAVASAACAGENLFSISARSGGGGPSVSISAPTPNFSQAAGTAVQIRADVTAPNGLTSATYSGVFTASGAAAFISETESFAQPSFQTLDNMLNPAAGAGTGNAWIIVKITDSQGETVADTVTIIIG